MMTCSPWPSWPSMFVHADLTHAMQQLDTLGEDILVLWRCVMLRRRILVIAHRPDEAVRAVCGAVALISSRSVDFAL